MAESLPKVKKFLLYGLAAVGAIAILFLLANLLLGGLSVSRRQALNYGRSAPGFQGIESQPPLDFSRGLLGTEKSVETDASGASQSSGKNQEGPLTQRKVVKNGSLSLLVKKAEDVAQNIQAVALRLGGFVANSRVYEVSAGIKSGTVTVRVPADRFDEAMGEIKKLAVKVESESVNAQDVTEQYVDLEARLKNAKAEEEQYLEILGSSRNVSDTLQVAQRLAEVRGRIESLQGQLQFLSRQVDMSTIIATLTAEADVEIFGIRWRPLYVAKQSLRRMLTGVADYADAMIAFIFALPVIALWLITAAIIAIFCWKLLKFIHRKFVTKGPDGS